MYLNIFCSCGSGFPVRMVNAYNDKPFVESAGSAKKIVGLHVS